MPDYGKFVNRLPADTKPELARALADVFRDLTADKEPQEKKLSKIYFASDFGVKYDGTDETVALQNAIDKTPTGGVLYIGEGTIIYSSVTIDKAMTLQGSHRTVTKLKTNSATAIGITVTTNSAVVFKEIEFTSTVTRTAGAFVSVNPAANDNSFSLFYRCVFADAYNAIDFVDAGGFELNGCYFANYTNIGVIVANVASPDTGDSTIVGCTFDAGASSSVAVNQNSSGGLRIVSNKFLNGTYQFLGEYNSGATQTSILIISDNSFENFDTAGIAFNSSSSTVFGKVIISDNQFSVPSNTKGIAFSDPGYDYIDVCTIGGNQFTLGNSATAMSFARITRLLVEPNSIAGNGTSEVGIEFDADMSACIVHEQDMQDLTNEFSGTIPAGSVVHHVTKITTTDATVTPVAFFALPDESAWFYETRVVGRKTDTTDRAIYHKEALAYRDGGGATIQGAVQDVSADVESNAAWDATVGVASNEVRTLVTGAAATTINWKVKAVLMGV